ncbi:MAG: LytTR family DNA-binding domain-containing protein [Bacteroidales bacterium]|jgi:DNA-binding LytR/AlgR family response regulator|nr:LytTR family DNA-binding domain-containing protein [Bacteroidales bacterium]
MMTCIAVDDEPLALEVIKKYVSDTPLVRLTGTFTDAIQALTFLKIQLVDLIILDIHMPDISGIQFLQSLKEPPMVIFTTAYAEYAVKGFELEAVDYLVKPIKFERFVNALEKAQKLMTMRSAITVNTEEDFLFVKSGYGTIRVNFNEILYIEGLDDYIKIHFKDEKRPVLSLMSLKSILEKLPAGRFMRIHRSFIVSLKNVRSIRKKNIFLGNIKIPIGDTYYEAVHHWISDL